MGAVIRFPIERRDYANGAALPEGQSAVIIPFPMRTSRAVTIDVVPAKAGTQ